MIQSDTSSSKKPPAQVDVVLSSGFLAFAAHLGFLEGLESSGVKAQALVGTSSGALVGALYAAGNTPDRIAKLLQRNRPLFFLRWRPALWGGFFGARPLLSLLEDHLPATFDELTLPFAVGVAQLPGKRHMLLRSGSLPQSVLASCAVPRLLEPVRVGGVPYIDGGAVDRTALGAWKLWRPGALGILHRVERSLGPASEHDLTGVMEVVSPRSRGSLWSLRDFELERGAAHRRAVRGLAYLETEFGG